MDKGKSLIRAEEEDGALVGANCTADASFWDPMPLTALEASHLGQPASSDVMQFHDFGMMHYSPQRGNALGGAYPEVPCFEGVVSLKASHSKGSDEDPFSMSPYMERSSSDLAPLPNAVTWSEPSFVMAPQPPAFEAGISNEEHSNELQQKQCTGGSSSVVPPAHSFTSPSGYSARGRYVYSDTMLAEIALHDPQRANRIIANRQSAIRCQEKRARHISELEQKLRILSLEIARLSARIIVETKFRSAMAFKNKELRLRMQTMELKAQLQDAQTESLRAELQQLQMGGGQAMMDGVNSSQGWNFSD